MDRSYRLRAAVRTVALALVLGAVACGRTPPERTRAPGPPVADSGRSRLVTLAATHLRVRPEAGAAAVAELPVGAALTAVPDSAAPVSDVDLDAWVQVATWDDRRGWVRADEVVETGLWTHYQAALGAPVTDARPAYPFDARWVVEAPYGSPGFTRISTVWLLGDSIRPAHATAVDSLEDVCSERRHRAIRLDATSGANGGPDLEAALLASPGRPAGGLVRLAVGELGEPDPALREAILGRIAVARDRKVEPGGVDAVRLDWARVGERQVWAAATWGPRDDEGMAHAAAFLAERDDSAPGFAWRLRTVVTPGPTSAEDAAPFRPLAVYATADPSRANLFLVEALQYEGARVDVYASTGRRFRRVYKGYYWGC